MCEIIECGGKKLKAVPTNKIDSCEGCFFKDCSLSICLDTACGEWEREDGQNVIFVEIANA